MKAVEINKRNIKEIKSLYRSAFPRIERKPFWLMLLNHKRNKMKIFRIEDENEFVGLAVMAVYKDKALLLYFAISPMQREKGYGSKALRLLMNKYSDKKFYLEIESTKVNAPNIENRLRRKSFYIKKGLSEMGLDVNLFGTDMEVLSNGAVMTFDEYIEPYEVCFSKIIRMKIKEVGRY